jgi:pimeloyl-ACP methyl ester carboxylesterase
VAPETLYAKTFDDVWIAYQVVGNNSPDIVLVNSWVSHLEIMWEQPLFRSMLEALSQDARVITFDKRGTGLSDRISRVPDLEARMDDIRAVMDAAGSARATLFGWGDGAALAALFAATYPERLAGLLLFDGNARMTYAPDYPWGLTEADWEREHARIPMIWGTRHHAREWAEMSWQSMRMAAPLPVGPSPSNHLPSCRKDPDVVPRATRYSVDPTRDATSRTSHSAIARHSRRRVGSICTL